MSGAEASLVLGLISSIITIIETTYQLYEAVEDEKGLPANFKKTASKLPLITKILDDAEKFVQSVQDEDRKTALKPTLEICRLQATSLQDIFTKVMPDEDDSRWDRYRKAVRTIGKGGRIEDLVKGILDNLQLMAMDFPEVASPRSKEQLEKAVQDVSKMEPSLPDDFGETPVFTHYGSGAQNNNTGDGTQNNNTSTGNQNIGGTMYIGTNHIVTKNIAVDIDRSCLEALRCPDTLAVKIRLKSNKDKLLYESINWINQDAQYLNWKDGNDVCLLLIRGGAGKGKTMMSIGLIEQLSLLQDASTVVTYFFCQNADYELRTLEAIIKGLILRLVDQQKELKESLRRRWDTENECFSEDVTSWRTLWNIFLEMLESCKCTRVYVIVDALDECQDGGMADFLNYLVRTGLQRPSKIKWLLTSRPLDSAERELLAGSDQVLVSLELNAKHISEAVKTYIAFKINELDRRWSYGPSLRQELEAELTEKAEDTFLWVSLVCKELEKVDRDKVLRTTQELPSGLNDLYHRAFNQLSEGESTAVNGCMRLLKVMMLAYRPLNIAELRSATGLSDQLVTVETLVDRCASFLKLQGSDVEFVHQSARDYLAQVGENFQSLPDSYKNYGHGEIALSCLSHLSQLLKVNLVDLPRPDSTSELIERNALLASVDYAATFWIQHLDSARQTSLIQNALAEQGAVGIFLCTKLLEWLECLSLLRKLSCATDTLKTLTDIIDSQKNPFLSMLVQDATRFLLRHYQTLATWPLQIYSSAMIFSPQTSIVRKNNLDKVPTWLRKLPRVEDVWAPLTQTFVGHSDMIGAVAFSPDSKRVASGSYDRTIKLWDATTGDLQTTLIGHSGTVDAIAFSRDSKQIISKSNDDKTINLWNSTTGDIQKKLTCHLDPVNNLNSVKCIDFSLDGKQIASASDDGTIKLWEVTTGNLQKTLVDHSNSVEFLVFSPDGKQIASVFRAEIKLWDTTTGNLQKTLEGHSMYITAVAFSPDGKQIVSGSKDETIKLWDTTTGNLQKTFVGRSGYVSAVAFSPDGKQIASGGSRDRTIKLWDTTTGNLQKTFVGYSSFVRAVAFSPDGKQIASAGSFDKTIKLWDTTTGNFQKTFVAHSEEVRSVAFSLDGKQIASGSFDKTIKLWDITTGNLQKTIVDHSRYMTAVAFSPDGKQIASGSLDGTIKLWDTTTGNLQKKFVGHSGLVRAVAFSPDGKQIASGSDKTIELWDITTGNLQKTFACHWIGVTAVAFSPDGKQIASGSFDGTIKLWDIAKSMKVSKFPGSTLGLGSDIKSYSWREIWREIKIPRIVSFLKFSIDGQYLVTNLGEIEIQITPASRRSSDFESLKHLRVMDQWVHYGAVPLFFLSHDLKPTCYDERGDQLVIGYMNGHVLNFDIDRKILHSIYKHLV